MTEEQAPGLLFVLSHGPLSGALARESLDAVMTAGLLNQAVSLLFVADGVYQLVEGEAATKLTSLMELAPIQLYAAAGDLQSRGLSTANLPLAPTALNNSEIQALFARHHKILSF
ncbi:hypothetical protein F6455_01585 [Proteobacteria bacterium 005FR1]|nr:hypothetical protein [Proteobacteria bacterium 005FR1]